MNHKIQFPNPNIKPSMNTSLGNRNVSLRKATKATKATEIEESIKDNTGKPQKVLITGINLRRPFKAKYQGNKYSKAYSNIFKGKPKATQVRRREKSNKHSRQRKPAFKAAYSRREEERSEANSKKGVFSSSQIIMKP